MFLKARMRRWRLRHPELSGRKKWNKAASSRFLIHITGSTREMVMARVLVSGGRGFIGRHVAADLIEVGRENHARVEEVVPALSRGIAETHPHDVSTAYGRRNAVTDQSVLHCARIRWHVRLVRLAEWLRKGLVPAAKQRLCA